MNEILEKKQAAKMVITAVKAYADAIKELKEIPSGELYAQLMPLGMKLETHEKILSLLVNAKLISINNHLIKWIV